MTSPDSVHPHIATKTGWGQVFAAVKHAGLRNCDIINLSLGVTADTLGADTLFGHDGAFPLLLGEMRMRSLDGKIPILCCAVGNDGPQLPAMWPACLATATPPIKEIIAVGAHDEKHRPYQYNQQGAKVLAFGVEVRSRENGRWTSRSGSSLATAVVSAAHAFFDLENKIVELPHPTTPKPLLHHYQPVPAAAAQQLSPAPASAPVPATVRVQSKRSRQMRQENDDIEEAELAAKAEERASRPRRPPKSLVLCVRSTRKKPKVKKNSKK